ncbi:hypothetical protein J7U12_00305 [Streptococcus thermophilus]|uniref:hypothetical protein n=1 Tax=Streptococcus thermophilus TaxID=1308 RepID=UPI001E420ECD|nr:hypothetical protein [Streptococcus thermophilus]MCD9220429.1 hypothetical protein [Streptococcus thermophilus]
MLSKIRKYREYLFLIISLIVAIYVFHSQFQLCVIHNYVEFVSSIQNIFIFISSVLIASFGITSFFSTNRFIQKLKSLNLDLLIIKELFDLSLLSFILTIIPSFFLAQEPSSTSDFLRVTLSAYIGLLTYFLLSLCNLIKVFREVLKITIDSEKERRKNTGNADI